ncbi:MAG: hypothetical protein HGA61_02930 [Candidatus Moranbacteria bacterium]|nr:hypothetical protein [Candidatus Moranbacteria bacterium]
MFLIYIIILYLLLLKVLPFVLYPNYLLPGKVEKYPSLVKLSMEIRGKDKKETLENVFRYLRKYHHSEDKIWKWENLATLFWIGDFSTQSMLEKKCFLWCHTQNRLLKSLLVNSGIFDENEIKIGRMFFLNSKFPYQGISVFIHQYLLIYINGTIFKIDPFYNIFEKLK